MDQMPEWGRVARYVDLRLRIRPDDTSLLLYSFPRSLNFSTVDPLIHFKESLYSVVTANVRMSL